MNMHLHLLGGAGRIGSALVESLVTDPLDELKNLWIYCDSTKTISIKNIQTQTNGPVVQSRGYSAFSRTPILDTQDVEHRDRHIVINLRGVNSKLQWLNQPLEAIEIQLQACRCLIDSDLWMHPGVEIIHFSSQLCDLIESSVSLEEMCEGQESYRRPYMISRLHQESMLSAHAFQHSIPTSFLRLPAVYGFSDDRKSPWVLNSLCRQLRKFNDVKPRNPERLVYLTHKKPLISYLRFLIGGCNTEAVNSTVRYLRPPMLQMSVETLACLVRKSRHGGSPRDAEEADIKLIHDHVFPADDSSVHLQLLQSSIEDLLLHG